MNEKSYFTGPFAPMCEMFVAQRRATGLVYKGQAMLLRLFDNFCKDKQIDNYAITKEIALAWCEKRPNEHENHRHARVGEMKRFAEFLVRQGYSSYLIAEIPGKIIQYTPYIFTTEEMHMLLARIDSLEITASSPIRHLSFPVLFRILYGCGLRISEALALEKRDVDLETGVLHIRHGKNDNERLTPMSASLLERVRAYSVQVHRDTEDNCPFIYKRDFARYSSSAIGKGFIGFMWDVGIPYRGKGYGPRIHDIRHTFVCHNIRNWSENGIPIYSKLPVLSKYLGHSSISSTQWYLRLTAEVYPHIREICEKELGGMYANIPDFSEVLEDE